MLEAYSLELAEELLFLGACCPLAVPEARFWRGRWEVRSCLVPPVLQRVRLGSDVLLASGVAPFFKHLLCLNVRDRVPVSNDLFVSLKTPGSPRANALHASTAWWCGFEGLLPLRYCGSVESGCPCSAVSALGKGAALSALPDPVRYGPESCSEEETASAGQPPSITRLPKHPLNVLGSDV